MGFTAYKSATSKRIFTNMPFKNGMVYEELTTLEGQSKAIVNLDISNSGDYAFPRPSFINSVLHNGINTVVINENTIVQKTRLNKDFLINFQFTVNENNYVNDEVITQTEEIKNTYGIKIVELEKDILNFKSNKGIKQVDLDYVYDGDTIYVKDDVEDLTSYPVRLLGLNAPELEPYEEGANEAKTFLTNLLNSAEAIYLMYDPTSKEKDDFNRTLAYVFIATEVSNNIRYYCVNQLLLLGKYAIIEYINDTYILYDTLLEAYNYAINNEGYGTSSTELFDIIESDSITNDVNIEDSNELYTYFTPEELEDNTSTNYFKKSVNENVIIDENFYDTEGFEKSNLEPTDLLEIEEDDTVYIEILKHEYTESSNNYVAHNTELAHVNLTWRNAISFLGRIIVSGVVQYKGIITLQFNGTDFKFILIKPEYLDPTAWSNRNVSSLAINAFDKTPYLYKDHIGDNVAGYFSYPVLNIAMVYDKSDIINPEEDINVIERYSNDTIGWVRPFIIFPTTFNTENLVGVFIRFIRDPDKRDEAEWKLITNTNAISNLWYSITEEQYLAQSEEKQKEYDNSDGTGEFPGTDEYDLHDVLKYLTPEATIEYYMCINKYEELLLYENANTFDFNLLAGKSLEIELKTVYYKGNNVTEIITYNLTNKQSSIGERCSNYSCTVTMDSVLPAVTNPEEFRHYEISCSQIDAAYTKVYKYDIKNTITNTTFSIGIVPTETQEFVFEYYKFSFEFHDISADAGSLINDLIIEIDLEDKAYSSVTTTPPIFISGEKVIKPSDIIKNHNIWNATHIALYDRFVVLYGKHIGNYSLQFLEYDNLDLAPFPLYQIEYDSEIKHIHVHRGAIYVFTDDGIYILHDGLLPSDMRNTFAYAGISLDFTEKNSVISLGNNVFVLTHNKGYSIRTNENVLDQSDIYTKIITGAVDSIIENPYQFLKERLSYSYGKLLEGYGNIHVVFKSFVINNNLYLTASYYFTNEENEQNVRTNIMLMFIYNKDMRIWKLYDTIASTFPIDYIQSNRIRGVDFVCINNKVNGMITIASFIKILPETFGTNIEASDVASLVLDINGEYHMEPNNIIPIQCFLDSGALGFNPLHRKKIRKIMIDIINVSGKSIKFSIVPYVDGLDYAKRVNVTATLDQFNNLVSNVELNTSEVPVSVIVNIQTFQDNEFVLDEDMFTTYNATRININTNLLGYIPGFKLYIPAISDLRIMTYGIVYRQQRAR